MAQYISKDALVAEIDRIVKEETEMFNEQCQGGYEPSPSPAVVCMRMEKLRSFLNTLEVKEVDLEKELVDYHNDNFNPCNNGTLLSNETGDELTWYDYECIAKHFFELGLKVAQKGE